MNKEDYMKLQYENGCSIVKTFIDTRYKILQFIGIYNGAILAIAFKGEFLFQAGNSLLDTVICLLSILVMLMGLATENSNVKFTIAYFEILRKIEKELGQKHLDDKIGIFSYGWRYAKESFLYRIFPVNRAHRLFYTIFLVFWIFAFVYTLLN